MKTSFDPADITKSVKFPQDVTDPVWPSEPVQWTPTDDTPAVETNNGLLEFLHHLQEEVTEWIDREGPHAHGHRMKPLTERVPPKQVFNSASDSWRGVTHSVDVEKKIAHKREDRQRIVVTNYGPGILYVSHDSLGTQAVMPQPNTVQIAANASRTFYTRGELWAFPAVIGTAQVVDIQDEYGIPEC